MKSISFENRQMNPIFYVPKYEEILSLLKPALEKPEESGLNHLCSFEGSLYDAMDWLLMNHHNPEEGRIHTGMLIKVLKEIATSYEMAQAIHYYSKGKNISNGVETVECKSEEKTLFAIGKLNEDYTGTDSDCYQTAGGYRNWIAPKDTIVKYYLQSDLKITASFEVSITVDHYNNNIGGLSTGGGTKKYEM